MNIGNLIKDIYRPKGIPHYFKSVVTPLIPLTIFSALLGCRLDVLAPMESKPEGFVTNDPQALWPDREIEVCWDRTNGGQFRAAEARIKNHIVESLKYGGVKVTGWQACPPKNEDMGKLKPMIWKDFEGVDVARSGGIGYDPNEAAKAIEMGTKAPQLWCLEAANYMESNCLLNNALHEFGHVLGLHHELNRADLKNEDFCKQQQFRGELNTLQIGVPDRYSVMNYCRLFAANAAGKLMPLSLGDYLTIKALYHGPLAFISLPFYGDQEYLLPHRVSIENLPIKIYGQGLSHYQVTWASPKEPCHGPHRKWSSWLPITRGIGIDDLPSQGAHLTNKPVKICVVGKSPQKEQSKILASSVVVIFDNGESMVHRP